jgi:branched-chain amino acid transport system ATP-binding protein
VTEGEICGLIGPNGAGKTTLFNCITGVNSLAGGSISFSGQRIDQVPARRIIALGIARTFQNVGMYADMSVLDNVMLGTHHLNRHRFVDAVARPWAFDKEERELAAFCRDILRELHLEGVADERAGNLPFGTLKHVEIARALASRPKLLLLDEPAAGLNHGELMHFGRLITHLRKAFGLTVLLVEHNMGLVMDLCERLIVLHLGKKLAEGTPADIKENPAVIAAYLGEAA